MVEAADAVARSAESSMRLFLLLHRGLRALEAGQIGADLVTSYLLKLADVVGVAPSLLVCASSGRVDDLHRFSFGGGGAICEPCRTEGAVRLRDGVTVYLAALARAEFGQMPETDVTLAGEAMGIARRFVEYHLDRAQLPGGDGVTLDLSGVDPERIPGHVGLILDGNGRWANARGLPRTAGHAAGEAALFDTVEGALEIGIEWLTAYTFSTENWSRSEEEVEFLMWFNEDLLTRRRDELHAMGVRMLFAGDMDDPRIPDRNRKHMAEAAEMTSANTSPQPGVRLQLREPAPRSSTRPDPSPPAVATGTLAADDIDEETLAGRCTSRTCPMSTW